MVKKEKISKVKSTNTSSDLEPASTNASAKAKKVKNMKKRSAPDPDVPSVKNHDNTMMIEGKDGDTNELTMGEKLENLRLLEEPRLQELPENEPPLEIKPPSADSVHVMLKQSLNAEDRDLLLKCLCSRDDKVISNSVSLLNPSDALKLLNSLISMTQLRGHVLASTLPWLRSLLIQHSSSIIAQESSLITLNSLYQLIGSRTSTFGSALELSTCLKFLFGGVLDDEVDEESMPSPVIFEDMDSDDEFDGDMEVNEESRSNTSGANSPSRSEGSDVMSQ